MENLFTGLLNFLLKAVVQESAVSKSMNFESMGGLSGTSLGTPQKITSIKALPSIKGKGGGNLAQGKQTNKES